MLSACSHAEGNFSDITQLVTDCASTPSSPAQSDQVNERCDSIAGASDSSGVSDPCLEITSPDVATYYGTQRYPRSSKFEVLRGHTGSSNGCICKRQRSLENHVEVQVLPPVVDEYHRIQEDRAHRLHRWLWDSHLPSNLSQDHRQGEGRVVPAVRCRQEISGTASPAY